MAAASSGETSLGQLKKVVAKMTEGALLKSDDVTFKKDGDNISISIATSYEPSFMKMFGQGTMPVSVSSHSLLSGAGEPLNIAFVLDTTASMNGARMTALKAAATSFVDAVEPSLTANQSKISIVPFADYVRIPTSYGDKNWIEVQSPQDQLVKTVDRENSINCRNVGEGENVYSVCDFTAYTEELVTKEWIGCMGSRRGDLHKTADYAGKNLLGFNGTRAHCYTDYNMLAPLSSNPQDLKTTIANLNARGDTYIPAGLLWGWRTLSPNEPFTEALNNKARNPKNILVLMSDGANTASIRGEDGDMVYHWGQPVSQKDSDKKNKEAANKLTLEICHNAKAEGIEIVTIAYELDDVVTVDMLRECASAPGDAYTPDSAAELQKVFENLSKRKTEVRITR